MLTNFTLTYFSCLSSAITNPKQVVFGSCYTSRSRPPPDRIASAVQSDCVRRPIGLRTGDDDFCKRVTIVRTTFCTGKARTSFCRQWA